MAFCPGARIVCAKIPRAITVRGLNSISSIAWPNSNINGGADYSVDFSPALQDGEYIVGDPVFSTENTATQSWVSTFGNIATAWLTWTASGNLDVSVGVLTSLGNTFQVDVDIYVSDEEALIAPVPPESPATPDVNTFKFLYDQFVSSLPTTDPGDGTSEWNNSGIVTRSIKS